MEESFSNISAHPTGGKLGKQREQAESWLNFDGRERRAEEALQVGGGRHCEDGNEGRG